MAQPSTAKPSSYPSTLVLFQDYIQLKNESLPYISAEPVDSNMYLWHFVLKGPEDTPYYGGYYHGEMLFESDFPFKPPTIRLITPNGRFVPNKSICMGINDKCTSLWLPSWTVGSILMGFLSVMTDDKQTGGACVSTELEKKEFARNSLEYNLNSEIFRELFPDLTDEINKRIAALDIVEEGSDDGNGEEPTGGNGEEADGGNGDGATGGNGEVADGENGEGATGGNGEEADGGNGDGATGGNGEEADGGNGEGATGGHGGEVAAPKPKSEFRKCGV